MSRISIVGNGGTEKTTLGFRLARELNLPLFHTENIIWQPGWQRTPEDQVRAEVERIIALPDWIFEGMGPLWTAEVRWHAADRVIFLDFPYEQCLEWALKRQDAMEHVQEPDLPEGMTRAGTRDLLVRALKRVEQEFIPRLRHWADSPELRSKTLWLRCRAELGSLTIVD